MAEKNSWVRDYFAVPLIVGLLLAAFVYLLPKFWGDSKELSFTVDPPLAYLDRNSLGNASVKVNDSPVPAVFAAKVRIWNSGNLPLKDLAVRFELTSADKDFRILSTNHNTQPAKEFGAISEGGSEEQSKRYIYQLLNPKDEDTLIFLTTAKADITIYSKAENLSVKSVAPNNQGEFKWYLVLIGTMIASILTTVVEGLFRLLRRRWLRNKAQGDNTAS